MTVQKGFDFFKKNWSQLFFFNIEMMTYWIDSGQPGLLSKPVTWDVDSKGFNNIFILFILLYGKKIKTNSKSTQYYKMELKKKTIKKFIKNPMLKVFFSLKKVRLARGLEWFSILGPLKSQHHWNLIVDWNPSTPSLTIFCYQYRDN